MHLQTQMNFMCICTHLLRQKIIWLCKCCSSPSIERSSRDLVSQWFTFTMVGRVARLRKYPEYPGCNPVFAHTIVEDVHDGNPGRILVYLIVPCLMKELDENESLEALSASFWLSAKRHTRVSRRQHSYQESRKKLCIPRKSRQHRLQKTSQLPEVH